MNNYITKKVKVIIEKELEISIKENLIDEDLFKKLCIYQYDINSVQDVFKLVAELVALDDIDDIEGLSVISKSLNKDYQLYSDIIFTELSENNNITIYED